MLQALRISNFAVIEESEVAFGGGLTVMTGETGAGKSIVIDALGLLLGGRADPEVVRAGCDEAVAEGLFLCTPVMAARLAELGLPQLGDEVSIRRVVGRTGRGKAYVNGALVTVGVLSRLMKGLLDIAGQHEHMSLFEPQTHRSMVDRMGGHEALLAEYREAYGRVKALESQLDGLGGDERTVQGRIEFLRYQLEEIDRVDPKAGEEVQLEQFRRRLAGAEKLERSLAEAEGLLSGEEAAALDGLGRVHQSLLEAFKVDGALEPLVRALAGAQAELEEVARGISRARAAVEVDPGRLAEADERLELLKALCRKHGETLGAGGSGGGLEKVLQRRADLAAELGQLENRNEVAVALEAELGRARSRARALAESLTQKRAAAADRLGTSVREVLAKLAMGQAQLVARVAPGEALGPEGRDEVELLFSANPGEPPRPLAKVASGGESSRLLLALKRVLSDSDDCRCYVFDEADAGVSGAVADVVGRMLKEVSRERQVVCITHLPQIAAYADMHLLIRKGQKGGRSHSSVVALDEGDSRARELARMMSGMEVTSEALGAAEALMRSASGAVRRVRAERERGRIRRSA